MRATINSTSIVRQSSLSLVNHGINFILIGGLYPTDQVSHSLHSNLHSNFFQLFNLISPYDFEKKEGNNQNLLNKNDGITRVTRNTYLNNLGLTDLSL